MGKSEELHASLRIFSFTYLSLKGTLITFTPLANLHSFPASQKLKSRKVIGELFENGKMLKAYPIRVVYSIAEYNSTYHSAHVQMGISVPKRSFKSAVDRNRIKRQVRECYRMHHHSLLELAKEKNVYLAMMMIYLDRKEPDFKYLDIKVNNLLEKQLKLLRDLKS